LAAGSACAQVDIKTVKPDGAPNKAAWMAQGTYGMMVHYLMKPQGNIKPRCPIEDYHAGEIHLLEDGKIRTDFVYPPSQGNIIVTADGKLRKRGQEARLYMPDSQFIDNVQWHCLLPIDLTFNPAVPNQYCHYTDKELFQFVDDVKSVGGALTINVPIDRANGHVPRDTHSQLVRLGEHLGGE